MILPFTHPNLDELAAFSASALSATKRDEISAHLLNCVRCQESLRFVRRMKEVAPQVQNLAPSRDLLARALEARAAGERRILPSTMRSAPRARRTLARVAVVAAAALALAVFFGRSDLVAEATDSSLIVRPEKPRAGDTIEITYRPAAGLFPKSDSLVLRGRMRTRVDDMYPGRVPASQTRSLAVLRVARNGEYRGRFALPPGIVFVSLAVESPDSSVVDANGTRLWEVMTYNADGRPTFDGLSQRLNDMMGRSWEEGYATSRRQSELYPDKIGSWSTRSFFERALFGEKGADSLARAYTARVDSLVVAAKTRPALDDEEFETIFFNAWVKKLRRGATPRDTQEFQYWWERIRREWPRHRQIAQHVAVSFSKAQWDNARFMLDSLERAYPHLVPLEGPGKSLANVGMQAADRAKDPVLYRRWLERSLVGSADSALRAAMALARRPEYRAEGMDGLRRLLSARPEVLVPARSVMWNATEYDRRVSDEQQRVLVALGRALIADGKVHAGLDTLTLASRGVWNVQVFRSLLEGYAAAGDSVNAQRMRVRLAVDPRTNVDSAAVMASRGRARIGASAWDSAAAAARAEMHALVRDRAKLKTLRGTPRVSDAQDRLRGIAELTGGRPAVVIFWSKDCGFAIEALPSIIAVSQRLHAAGTPVILVNNGPRTKEVDDLLAEKKWTLPVYYDSQGEMGNAFNNFGTPQYFVLDAAGRIRFDFVDEVAELIAQVGSLEESSAR